MPVDPDHPYDPTLGTRRQSYVCLPGPEGWRARAAEVYARERSLTRAAAVLGVSRTRVRQVLLADCPGVLRRHGLTREQEDRR